ncbi:MAG: formate dehydrogenase accessory sulfurtransferase FdhD [Robiginitomaculum sp.]|nr:formate dehydrogenase accessory sulfurtransferase FdhD [Robiginitomaculum sp.]
MPFVNDRLVSANLIGDQGLMRHWVLPNEVPIGFIYNKLEHAVMMATPADLEDFALGFSLAEGVLHRAEELLAVRVCELEHGIELHITIPGNRLQKLKMHRQRRAHRGRAGCGICGVDNLADALRPLPKLPADSFDLERTSILQAISSLPDNQPMRANNHTVHGAAWVSNAGEILLVREDIGRHNALDKMIGARGSSVDSGFALLSSRCTYELVQKCAMANIGTLVCLSAPTINAVETAVKANIRLCVFERKTKEVLQFSSPV